MVYNCIWAQAHTHRMRSVIYVRRAYSSGSALVDARSENCSQFSCSTFCLTCTVGYTRGRQTPPDYCSPRLQKPRRRRPHFYWNILSEPPKYVLKYFEFTDYSDRFHRLHCRNKCENILNLNIHCPLPGRATNNCIILQQSRYFHTSEAQ